jgi:hypothetical protein
MDAVDGLTRRTTLALIAGLAASGQALAQTEGPVGAPTGRRLVFAIVRNGQTIGQHTVTFKGDAGDFTVDIDAFLLVKIGPIPVFHFHHQATEHWRDGLFASLHSQSVSNGKHEQVTAARTTSGVTISTGAGRTLMAAPDALPLTHWNQAALSSPLFNPQTGALLKESIARQGGESVQLADGRAIDATRYSLSGEADIIDWYDSKGVWTALRAKVLDGSHVDYRRSV